eukprot:scaffold23496_cov188-Cylindrotheca_fusiformis.AAC.9
MISRTILVASLVIAVASVLPVSNGFVPQSTISTSRATPVYVFGGKKKQTEDFSDIEVRDLTREEMLDINRQNEEIMNMELSWPPSRLTRFLNTIPLPHPPTTKFFVLDDQTGFKCCNQPWGGTNQHDGNELPLNVRDVEFYHNSTFIIPRRFHGPIKPPHSQTFVGKQQNRSNKSINANLFALLFRGNHSSQLDKKSRNCSEEQGSLLQRIKI